MISKEEILTAKILIVDDDNVSVNLLAETLKKAGYRNITSTTDSRQAAKLYAQIRPDLLALDLNMPYLTGFDVMAQLKEIETTNYLPIIVLSGEDNQQTRFKALQSGAKEFLDKPYDRVEVLLRINNLIEVRLLHNEVRLQNQTLEKKVKERTHELYETQLDVIQRLGRAVEYRDSETGLHIIRMSYYSACLAKEAGLNDNECEMILNASPLHDIGKIGIPDSILLKAGKLTEEEWTVMKTHTTIGAELLSGSTSKLLNLAKEIAMTHHEKWDGTGYPKGLKTDEIPLVGRICGLCDVFDALTSERPYKKAWSPRETVEEMSRQKGKHFDPGLVDCFIKILPRIELIKEKYTDANNKNISLH